MAAGSLPLTKWRKNRSGGGGLAALRRRERNAAYLFLTPILILFFVFIAGPLIGAMILSLYRWDLFSSPEFTGLDNFRRLTEDGTAIAAIRNTFVFTFWSVVLHIGVGLLLALGVNAVQNHGIVYFLRTAFFFPMLISWAAASLIWVYIMDPNFGWITYYLDQMGLNAPNFLIDRDWAMPAIIFIDMWKTVGFTFIILLTGLQSIPIHLYEAAEIDGAGSMNKFWNITVPMLSPTLFFAFVITFIGAFQIFEPMFIMTAGGPRNSTLSIVQHIYQTGFQAFEMGYASALALVVFVVILFVTILQIIGSRWWVFHE